MSTPVAPGPGTDARTAGRPPLMTPRLLAVATFTLGAAALYAFLVLLGMAPGAPTPLRVLREGKQRTAMPARVERLTAADFVALPHAAPLARVKQLQGRAVSLEGWVQRMLWASDGDLHLELAVDPRGPGSRDTAYVTAEITSAFRRGSRTWGYEALVAALRPNHGGNTGWDAGPARVRVTGWLLWDWQYDREPSTWSLANEAPRLTGWEIHPVTKIERWDDGARAWREWAR